MRRVLLNKCLNLTGQSKLLTRTQKGYLKLSKSLFKNETKSMKSFLMKSELKRDILCGKKHQVRDQTDCNKRLFQSELQQMTQQIKNNESYQKLRWMRRLLIALFLIKVLQEKNVRCEYDINDMMATIEIQEQVLEEQQQQSEKAKKQSYETEHQHQKTHEKQNQQKDKEHSKVQKQQKESQQSNLSHSYPNNQQRYATVEQMLKDQMESSEQFGSVEQRLLIKQIQANKNKQSIEKKLLSDQKIQDVSKKQQKGNENETVADVVFRQEPNTQIFKMNENPTVQETKQHQQIQTNKQKLKEFPVETKKQQKSTPQVKQVKQDQIKEQIIKLRQNSGVIQVSSESSFEQLSKNIQNFLKLRGVSVHVFTKKDKNSLSQQRNSDKQILKLNLCNKIMDCKQIIVGEQFLSSSQDIFHHLNNFLNPPLSVNSIDQAKQLLKIIEKDQNIIGSYIPQPQNIEKQPKTVSQFDTYSPRFKQPDPVDAQKLFREYKYLSSSKKSCFVIVRNKQVANYLKIPTNKIGLPHLLYKYDKELNGKQSEPNCKIDGEFYHSIGNFDKLIQKQNLNTVQKVALKINTLSQRNFTLINSVQDMYDKIRQLRQQSISFSFEQSKQAQQRNPMKKLFVIKINDPKSQNEINAILQKLSKMNKNQVSIVKTQSQLLLKSLGIHSNQEYGTIRLLDLQQKQQTIIKNSNNENKSKNNQGHFKRYVPNVPFQVESLSRWISNITPFDQPYEEYDRLVNKLKASYPGDFNPSPRQDKKVKLVLFYKQGCKGCKMMQDLLSRIVDLKQSLKQSNNSLAKRIAKEISLKYRIQNIEHLRDLQISKFNILNDDSSIQVPQTTPTIYLFNGSNTEKVALRTDHIFSHLNRINTNNGELVQDLMVRDLIEEIQKGNQRFQSVY